MVLCFGDLMNRTGFRVMCIVCNLEADFEGKVKALMLGVQPLYGGEDLRKTLSPLASVLRGEGAGVRGHD